MKAGSPVKVSLVSLGCARTLVDSEVALGGLKEAGYEIVRDVRDADVAVVNTCGFIEEAKVESIETILRLCQLKKQGRLTAVVVLGCLAQRHGEELRKEIGDEVDGIVGTDSFGDLARVLEPLRKKEKVFEVKAKPRYLLNADTPRYTLTPEHLAYVKISEGCINACSYCVIPRMKGAHRSRLPEDVLAEIKGLGERGRVSEINLIGQDTAAYGYDLDRTFKLPDLLRRIDALGAARWVRLLYAHPGHVSEDLIDAIADSPGLCKYVDFPIEHSHDAMLTRMNRGVTRAKMLWGIETLRKKMPQVALRTTVIVGFPGETEEEFKDLMDFLKDVRFERLGTFIYSPEEGARSLNMPDPVPQELKQQRFNAVMAQQQEISQSINDGFLGKEIEVLVEEKDAEKEGLYYGRTQADAPEVDCQVILETASPLGIGNFIRARVTDALEYDLVASPL